MRQLILISMLGVTLIACEEDVTIGRLELDDGELTAIDKDIDQSDDERAKYSRDVLLQNVDDVGNEFKEPREPAGLEEEFVLEQIADECMNYEYAQIEPKWLTEPYDGEWPLADTELTYAGNYNNYFWTNLDCYNTQAPTVMDQHGYPRSCRDEWHEAPPSGIPFSCDLFVDRFCQQILNPYDGFEYTEICEDGGMACSSCFKELSTCIFDRAGECPAVEERPIYYQQHDPFIECYNKVTSRKTCRWTLPDVCKKMGIPKDSCAGPEWPLI